MIGATSTPPASPAGREPSLLVVILVAVVAAGLAIAGVWSSLSARVVYLQDGSWSPSPGFTLRPRYLAVSPSGAVWSVGLGIECVEGRTRQYYSDRSLGANSRKKLRGGLAFRNGEVWAGHEEGILRFDGRTWRLYRNALTTGRPESIAANTEGVWAVDDSGNLSHFDGTSWSIADLATALPEAGWGGLFTTSHPALALTFDGALWMVWQGIWRFDGHAWREVQPHGVRDLDARLVGAEPHRLWLAGNDGVEAISESGSVTARYLRPEWKLSPNNRIYSVASGPGQVYIGTSEGLLVGGDGGWRRIAGPEDAPVIVKVAVAPGGVVWALVDQPGGLARYVDLIWTGPYRGIWLVMAGLIVWLMRWWKRRPDPGEFPAREWKWPPRLSVDQARQAFQLILGVALIVFYVSPARDRLLATSQPLVVAVLALLVLFLMALVVVSFRPSRPPSSPQRQREVPSRPAPLTLTWVIEPKLNPELSCPSCGVAVDPCTLAISTDLVECRHCATLFPLENLVPRQAPGIRVADRGANWKLTVSARSSNAAFFWILPVSILAALVTTWKNLQGAATVVIPVCVLLLFVKAAMETWGRYSISVENSVGRVFSGVGRVGAVQVFRFDDLHSIRLENATRNAIFVEHQLILEADQEVWFGKELRDAHLCYIAVFLLRKRLACPSPAGTAV